MTVVLIMPGPLNGEFCALVLKKSICTRMLHMILQD